MSNNKIIEIKNNELNKSEQNYEIQNGKRHDGNYLSSVVQLNEIYIENNISDIDVCHYHNILDTGNTIATKNNNNNYDSYNELDTNCCKCTKNINKNANARRRWKILARAITKKTKSKLTTTTTDDENMTEDGKYDAKRFTSASLINHERMILANEIKEYMGHEHEWNRYKIILSTTGKTYNINIHHVVNNPTPKDLMGFNNTGNICVWPSEEALSYYILKDLTLFKNKWILELGGGMTSLSGLIIAKYSNALCVHLTDGNSTSVENIKRTVRLNDLNSFIKTSILKWESLPSKSSMEYRRYDYILCADCLFFDESRNSLVDAINFFLSPDGTAIVVAPKRGNSIEMFVRSCMDRGFKTEIHYRYSEDIWQKYFTIEKSNVHDDYIQYPILIELTKSREII